jgi:putative spermidine/putrescine transport system substrate-binding protein
MTMRRAWAVAVLALAAVTGISGARAQSGEDTRFKGVTLRVATWGGATRDALRDYVGAELEKRGAKVEFVIGSPQDNLAKLIAARGQVPFDVVEFLGTMRPEIEARNLLAPLDMSRIPNARGLKVEPPSKLMVPTWITEETIMYNKEAFAKAGIAPPKSLADLRDPKLAGRVMIPDIASGGGIESVGAFALTAGGNEGNIGPGLALINQIPNVRFWKAGGEVVTQFKSGDIWAAVAHAGWALRTSQAGVPIATVRAKIGDHEGMVKEGFVGVVKGSRNQEAAEFFINTYLSPEAQAKFALKVGAVPVVQAARSRMADDPTLRELVVLDPAKIANMVRLDPSKIDLAKWNDEWNRTVASR